MLNSTVLREWKYEISSKILKNQKKGEDELQEIIFSFMHEIVEIVKSNDVKHYTEKEPAHLKEVELNNRTVEKMSCYK